MIRGFTLILFFIAGSFFGASCAWKRAAETAEAKATEYEAHVAEMEDHYEQRTLRSYTIGQADALFCSAEAMTEQQDLSTCITERSRAFQNGEGI
jgi:hypothetical protein